MTKKNDSSKLKYEKESVQTTVEKSQNSVDPDVIDFDGESTNDVTKSDDSWTSSSKNLVCETEISEMIPPETIGIGTNKRVSQTLRLSFIIIVIITEYENITI